MAQTKAITNTEILFNSHLTAIPTERIISLEEISWHDNQSDCWIVIYDFVYDVTKFLGEHPGGHEILLEYAGRDGTCAFQSVEHSKAALFALKNFLIGVLPVEERIFRSSSGLKLFGN